VPLGVHDVSLLLELGGLLFGLGVVGRLAARVGLSPIPLYLLAGLAVGRGGIHPLVTSRSFVETGAKIGVVLLLLLLGLEYTADELVSTLRAQAPSGVVDLLLNAVPGVATAVWLGWGATAALAMGGVTAVSSSGIVSKLLADLGRLPNRETPGILGVLVLEDLAMAVYLPVLTGLLARKAAAGTAAAVAVAVGAFAVVLFVALRYGPVISRLVFSSNDEVLLLRVLGLALLVAGLTQALGLSSAVGAFLVGIALSGHVVAGARTVLAPLRDLFAAVFFVFFGLQAGPAAFSHDVPPVACLVAASVVTKLVSGWYAGRRVGAGRGGRVRAAASLVPRGEFSIVVAGVAVASGAPHRFASVAVAYVIVTAVLGPLAARVAEPVARWSLRSGRGVFAGSPRRVSEAAGRGCGRSSPCRRATCRDPRARGRRPRAGPRPPRRCRARRATGRHRPSRRPTGRAATG